MVTDNFEDFRRWEGIVNILIGWRRFQVDESDWFGIDSLKEDVHEMLQEYLEYAKKNGTPRHRELYRIIWLRSFGNGPMGDIFNR